ncbi:DNA polymerase kappa subunit [Clonorchis sinensis]|uniref:DNA polymerase kappa n=1 Tax=Clonorchis sinensis TaxID=79923 RepID=G7YQ96_CLOSI|nr:DNA polymerase kappa subunit [Clonorchis sinensis]
MQQLEQDDSNCSVDAAGCGRYSTNKAGMNGLDRATILQIILENSKGSKFYENELRRERILQQQIERKLAQLKTFTSTMISMGETEADSVLKSIETKRCFSRCIMHLDMDAFYASVEIRDQPDLRFHPVAVGSNSMLSTSNYIARRFGVRPGLPGFLGKKLCPDLRIVPPDFARYTAASRVVRSVLRPYAAIGLAKDKTCGGPPGSDNGDDHPVAMVTASLDEAYLDLTQHLKDRVNLSQEQRSFWPRPAPSAPMLVCRCLNRTKIKSAAHGDSHTQTCTVQMQSRLSEHESSLNEENGTTISCTANMPSDMVDEDLAVCDNCGLLLRSGRRVFGTTAWEAAREIRFRIFCATRLTASAGLGPNTLTAKIASDWCKPSGQFEVARTSEAVTEFMRQLPVRKVPGIGHVTERRLEAFGIRTCRDLIEKRGILWNLSSRSAMGYYLRIAVGHSDDDWLPCSSPEILTRPNGSNVLALSEADSNQGRSEVDRKSMSVERTFPDTSEPEALILRCRQLSAKLSEDLKEEHVKGRSLTLKLKLDTFENRSRSQMLPDYTNDAEIIATFATEILREEMANERMAVPANKQIASTSKPQQPTGQAEPRALTLRLMGLRMSSLLPAEMCPQIRQRSLEEALAHVVATTQLNFEPADKQSDKLDPTTCPQTRAKQSGNTGSAGLTIRRMKSTPSRMRKSEKPVGASILSWTQVSNVKDSVTSFTQGDHILDSRAILLTCPVCNVVLKLPSEEEFNTHLDDCLNRNTIAEAIRETLPSQGRSNASSMPQQTSCKAKRSLPLASSPACSKRSKVVQTNRAKRQRGGPLDRFMLS